MYRGRYNVRIIRKVHRIKTAIKIYVAFYRVIKVSAFPSGIFTFILYRSLSIPYEPFGKSMATL